MLFAPLVIPIFGEIGAAIELFAQYVLALR